MAPEPLLVLLIDDQPLIGEAVRRLIRVDPGLELFCCHEPRHASARALQLGPDVILLDVMMPDVDGLTLLRTLRADPQTAQTRIVMLSGNDDAAARRQAADAGADGFLVKLPAAQELIAAIRGGSIAETPRPADDQTLDAAVLASLREAMPGRPEFTDTLVHQFRHEATSLMEQLRGAVRDLDAETLRSTAHRLKGACQTIGARRLAALSGQLEHHAGRPLRAAVVTVLMNEMDEAFRELLDALATERTGAD